MIIFVFVEKNFHNIIQLEINFALYWIEGGTSALKKPVDQQENQNSCTIFITSVTEI